MLPRWLHVGCYTSAVGGAGEGIVSVRRDIRSGRLGAVEQLQRCAAPSYLAAHPGGHSVYAVHEEPAGELSRWRTEPGGALALDVSVPSGGAGPCHVEVTNDGRHLLTANYGSGAVVAYRLGAGGEIRGLPVALDAPVRGGAAARPHMIVQRPGTTSLLVVDLGLDLLGWYAFDAAGELSPALHASTALPAGSGPRRVVFHPAGHAYVLNELTSTVTVVQLETPAGVTRTLDTICTTATGAVGNYPSEMALSEDVRTLYAANRGHDTIGVFAIRGTTLKLLAEVPSGGEWPQHFVIIGRHLYVANQRAHHIAVHELDPDTGVPGRICQRVETGSPSCLLAVA